MEVLLISYLGVESAGFPGQSPEEIDRLLHMVRFVSITLPLF
jgi:hypothetical protein